MPFVLPGLVDNYRNLKNGKRRYVGNVVKFNGDKKPSVIAQVYGESLEEMRRRKHAVSAALKTLESK